MSVNRSIVNSIFKRHPEVEELSALERRMVARMLDEAIALASRDILTESETETFLKGLVHDAGKPSATLRAYRNRTELTQRELSKKSGIPQPHIAGMEKGRRPIGLESAKKLGKALGVDYRKLL